jgi:transcriptional regulator with XRE-family HTH domain
MNEERFLNDELPGEDLDSAEERELWALLRHQLVRPEAEARLLGDESVQLFEAVVPPVEVPALSRAACDRLCEEVELDLEFERRIRLRRREPTLGEYLAFLRERAALSLDGVAKRFRVPFQWMTELERDRLAPQEISAPALCRVLRRLRGSLLQTEALLASTIQAPPTLPVHRRASLYRKGSATDRASAEASSRIARGEPDESAENPEYREQCEAVERLREEVRSRW